MNLGEYLRTEREQKKISLEQLQETTKIRTKYLLAIEEGRYSEIPGEVYLKGFLRSYAEAIGLDGAQVLAAYNDSRYESSAMSSNIVQKSSSVEESRERKIDARRQQATRSRKLRGLSIAVAVMVLAVVGSVLTYKAIMGDKPSAGGGVKTFAAADDAQATSALDLKRGTAGARGKTSAESLDTPRKPDDMAQGESASQGVSVVTFGRARSWMRVLSDGAKVFEGFLAKGESKEWKAAKSIEVTFGNAGGVQVSHNGTSLGVIGETGRLVTRTFGPPVIPKPGSQLADAQTKPSRAGEQVFAEELTGASRTGSSGTAVLGNSPTPLETRATREEKTTAVVSVSATPATEAKNDKTKLPPNKEEPKPATQTKTKPTEVKPGSDGNTPLPDLTNLSVATSDGDATSATSSSTENQLDGANSGVATVDDNTLVPSDDDFGGNLGHNPEVGGFDGVGDAGDSNE